VPGRPSPLGLKGGLESARLFGRPFAFGRAARGYNASKGVLIWTGGMFDDTLTDKAPRGTFAPKWAFREDNATPSTF
jgi:hypothetical protein